jgi:hypothetical protein
MAIQTLHDTGSSNDILSKYDGGVYQVATNDCVIGGVGDEFTLQYSASSLTVSFNVGSEAVIGGSFFKVISTESITLEANSTIYLCANIDLTRPNSERGAFAQRTANNMQSDNINGTGTSRDLLLYIITTSGSGITSVEDKRVIKNEALKEIGFGIDSSRKICNMSANGSPVTWTATEDCFVYISGSAYGQVRVDNVQLAGNGSGNFSPNPFWLPIKKGTILYSSGANYNYIWAWGLKGSQ